MRKVVLSLLVLGLLCGVAAAQSTPSLDTKLSKSTAKPGETITVSADLSNLVPAQGQKAFFVVSLRPDPLPRPRRPRRPRHPRRPRRRGPRFIHFIGAAELKNNGNVYTATLPWKIPSRISRDLTVYVTSATVDRSGPRPSLVIGDSEKLLIDAP